MSHATKDPFHAQAKLTTPVGERTIYSLETLRRLGPIDSLPYSIKVLLESCLRTLDGRTVTEEHVRALAGYDARAVGEQEIAEAWGTAVIVDRSGVALLPKHVVRPWKFDARAAARVEHYGSRVKMVVSAWPVGILDESMPGSPGTQIGRAHV